MKIDVRYKLFLLFLISVISFIAKDIMYGSVVFLVVSIISFLMGQKKKVLHFSIVYLVLIIFIYFAGYIPVMLRGVIFMPAISIRMFMPLLLYAQSFLATTTISEMVTALYALLLPRSFTITFAVAMRFFPTAREELGNIRDAMKLRAIGFSLNNLFTRPVLLVESFLTPLMVRSSTIAEELSAASITRGLDNPASRTTFIKLHISVKDTLITLLFTFLLCGIPVARELLQGRVL